MFRNRTVRPARAALLTGIAAAVITAGSSGVSAQSTAPAMTTGALFGRNFACMITNLTERSITVVFETIDFGGDLIDTDQRTLEAAEAFALRDNSAQERFQYCRFRFPGSPPGRASALEGETPRGDLRARERRCQGRLVAQ